jgi:hypothetical protein
VSVAKGLDPTVVGTFCCLRSIFIVIITFFFVTIHTLTADAMNVSLFRTVAMFVADLK